MAAVTAVIGAGVALAGLGMNIAQQQKAKKDQAAAERAAKAAANRLQNITEQNAFKNIETPTLGFEMAQQSMDRQTMAGVNALQAAGPEAVIGGIPGLTEQNREGQMQLAAAANEAQFTTDLYRANAQQDINMRKSLREQQLETSRLEGAQVAAAQAQATEAAAIGGIVESAGTALQYGAQAVPLYQEKSKLKAQQAEANKALSFKAPTWQYLYEQEGQIDWGNPG